MKLSDFLPAVLGVSLGLSVCLPMIFVAIDFISAMKNESASQTSSGSLNAVYFDEETGVLYYESNGDFIPITTDNSEKR